LIWQTETEHRILKPMNRMYIERLLYQDDKKIRENDLPNLGKVVLVLAEPGAGKSELLRSIADSLGVSSISASIFRHKTIENSEVPLIIDALDEVARLDEDNVNALVVKASETKAQFVVFSSRSQEWSSAQTRLVEECFGVEAQIVRLHPFSEEEQKRLFESWFDDEDFDSFFIEAERFELSPLLGNPQFLRLFSEAFIQSGGRFESKEKIFLDAITRLASEREDSPKQGGRPPIQTITDIADEIFAKLLLSGTSGISQSEYRSDRNFPYLKQLCRYEEILLKVTLDTRLFELGDDLGRFTPVHRIVAEYCAARCLVGRIQSATDHLTISRVLALVAPNGAVRDDLRGLLGWIATLGNEKIQSACIKFDPYAVLANGDPSQLQLPGKKLLLHEIRRAAEIDPYFRRSDAWRRFSVAGFFDETMLPFVQEELAHKEAIVELRDLLLEILDGSSIVSSLAPILQTLLHDKNQNYSTRVRVQRLLLNLPQHNHLADFLTLIGHGEAVSLQLAVEAAALYPKGKIAREEIFLLLNAVAKTEGKSLRSDGSYRLAYHIKELISQLESADTTWLLDKLTDKLSCKCNAKSIYTCTCLHKVSAIVGQLLDHYFSLFHGPYYPKKIWSWIKPLRFRRSVLGKDSRSVSVLQNDDTLRQSIHRMVLETNETTDGVWQAHQAFFSSHGHSGLRIDYNDLLAIVGYAFETHNLVLWDAFYSRHNYYEDSKHADQLRTLMRAHARESSDFLRIWSLNERRIQKLEEKSNYKWRRYRRRQERQEAENKLENQKFFRDNHDQIIAGRHWGALDWLANRYLMQPRDIDEVFEDVTDAETALRNSFEFLEKEVPSLEKLADGMPRVVRVLHAASLAELRFVGHLKRIPHNILAVVRTDIGGFDGYKEGESEELSKAIDHQIFRTEESLEQYARTLLEPQLQRPRESHTGVGLLQYDKAFEPVSAKLSLEWLQQHKDMPDQARQTLFDVYAAKGKRSKLRKLIEMRCQELIDGGVCDEQKHQTRDFWFLRSFFFLEKPQSEVLKRLQDDKETIFWLERRTGRINRTENEHWPELSAEKIHAILNMYLDKWPKVFLPNSYGTGDPPAETAYRFLTDVVWRIEKDTPDRSIPVLRAILEDSKLTDFHRSAKSQLASTLRKQALSEFVAPTATEVASMIDDQKLATVEDLRAFLVEEIARLEAWVRGNETDPLDTFYSDGNHVNENTARNRIVDRLQARFSALNLDVAIERYMADQKRCDITVSSTFSGRKKLLVIEVKGQWHSKLFSAANEQLYQRYSSHPDAAHQGVYLVLWFGPNCKIAGNDNSEISSPVELKNKIVEQMPSELQSAIDVVVLDLSPRK
jgi:hypothetical protein